MKPTWQTEDGTIQLYLGDNLSVLPCIKADIVDAVVTDPPYGIVNEFGENTGNGKRTMQFEWDHASVTDSVIQALESGFSMCKRSAGCFVFCGGDQFGRVLEVVRSAKFTAKPAAWVKTCPPPAGKGNWWPSAFELAVYGYRNSPYFGDDDPKRCNVFYSDSYRYGQPGKVDHPTQKPLGLMTRIVSAIVPPEGVALDLWMGSGTTGVACVRTGRRFIGMEVNPDYFEISKQRIKDELKKVQFLNPPKVVQRELI